MMCNPIEMSAAEMSLIAHTCTARSDTVVLKLEMRLLHFEQNPVQGVNLWLVSSYHP